MRCIKTCPGKVICVLLRVLFIVISPCFLTGAIFTCIPRPISRHKHGPRRISRYQSNGERSSNDSCSGGGVGVSAVSVFRSSSSHSIQSTMLLLKQIIIRRDCEHRPGLISKSAHTVSQTYNWPSNVRDLTFGKLIFQFWRPASKLRGPTDFNRAPRDFLLFLLV